jgi:hypothetical protein
MSKFVMFTNASSAFDGESIAINKDVIASVFEILEPDSDAKLQRYTILFGINKTDWRVKESYLEAVAMLNIE